MSPWRGAVCAAMLLGAVIQPGCTTAPPVPAELGPFTPPQVDLGSLPGLLRTQALKAEKQVAASPDDPEALGELAFHYLEYDFPMAAAACLERAALLEPDSLRWRYYLGLAYEKAGEQDRTIRALEAAVAIDGDYAPALVRLGESLLDVDVVRAAEAFSRARRASPKNPRAILGQGRASQAQGRAPAAERFYREAIRVAPEYAQAHYALAMVLSGSGRGEEAGDHLREHARGGVPPSDDDPLMAEMRRKVAPSYLIVQGEVKRLTEQGRLDDALQLLNRSMATDITGVTARKQLGDVLGIKGRFQEAVELYSEILAATPADHETRTNLGQALEGIGDPRRAEGEYRRVLESHHRYAPALVFLGRLLSRSGRAEEGLDYMARGVKERPAEGQYRYLLGVELARAGRTGEAEEEVAITAGLMPDHAGARYTLGQLRLALGDTQGAMSAWQEAVALSPGLAEGWIGLAGIALDEGDPGRAVEWAEEGCGLSRYKVRRHMEVLARAYLAAGRRTEAADLLGRLGKAAP